MLRFLADECFDGRVVVGLNSSVRSEVLRVQDVGLAAASDPEILAWAANQGRVVLTHDARTMSRFAKLRISQRLPMTGLVIVSLAMPIGDVIRELELVATCAMEKEIEGQIWFLPLR